MTKKYTPAMQQYIDMKKQCTDSILFFRIWDFYETFFEDAKISSKVLDLVLTSKNKDSEDPIPMAGIPHHSIDKYIPKLVANWYKIAIAEQVSDPIPGKIVERKITQIITPGTHIQENKKSTSNMLALSFEPIKNGYDFHIAWGDFSLWEYWTKSFADIENLQKFVQTINPVEIIIDIEFPQKDEFSKLIKQYQDSLISIYDVPHRYEEYLLNNCKIQTLSSYGKAVEEWRWQALALLFSYLQNTQQTILTNVSRISFHSTDNLVLMDDVTIKNLEIFSSSYEWLEKYSLIWVLDNTRSFAGARLLRNLLANPSNDIQILNARQNHIQHYFDNSIIAEQIHKQLWEICDIPKTMSNLLYRKLLPSTFIRLRKTLKLLLNKELFREELKRIWLQDSIEISVEEFYQKLEETLKDDEDFADDMNFIRDGVDLEIDKLRDIAFHSDKLLIDYQQYLTEMTGVSNIKIRFILNQWYFIEITNKDISDFENKINEKKNQNLLDDKLNIIRRNTLKWAQRFSSPYLDNLQEDILKAREQLIKQEFSRLANLQQEMWMIVEDLMEFASLAAYLDLYTSQSILARENWYIRPKITEEEIIDIEDWRHPVIEKYLPQDQQFIPNNLNFAKEEDFLHIITGPNMWGKSTYLRQNALIVLMAHCGFFVPAQKAKIGLVDGIFARVGSWDLIAKNQSTFMTEMIEVANILNNASKRSFVIFDELGRGTSTYDWLALTKAILEYMVEKVKAKTLIATHYHELIKMEDKFSWIKNYSVSVYESDKEVVFMKKIVAGGASKSYGLDVAKLAGISPLIIAKAEQNLQNLEQNKINNQSEWSKTTELFTETQIIQDPKFEKIKSLIQSYDIDNMTPLQALQLLAKIKDELWS